MGKPFSEELGRVAQTLTWCSAASVPDRFTSRLADHGQIVAVGSGGSFSAADFAARAWQSTHSRIAVALTPMEYAERSFSLGSHQTLLLSAEGTNSDIQYAAAASLAAAERTTALTFRTTSRLLDLLADHESADALAFDAPWGKDGYLATNSLLASVMMIARLHGLSADVEKACSVFAGYRSSLAASSFVRAISAGRRVLVLHGPSGTPSAIDLESKFAEADLGTVQRTDLRQFAHGRHIQLAGGTEEFAIVALVASENLDLWVAVRSLLPRSVPVLTVMLPDGMADATLQGLLSVFALVEAAGMALGRDPGMPDVPAFARELHAIEAARYMPEPQRPSTINRKVSALRRRGVGESAIRAALDEFVERLGRATIRGLVLDFDGTCCETSERLEGIAQDVLAEMKRLLDRGVRIAFATGRGDSLYTELRARLGESTWGLVLLGCHSGSSRVRLSDPWLEAPPTEGLKDVSSVLASAGIDNGQGYKMRVHGGQFTVECGGLEGTRRAFLVVSEIAHDRPGWRSFRSSHSVDLLTGEAGKRAVVEWLAGDAQIDSETEILRIGDRGEVFGNDAELLGSGLALTVDGVSADSDTCWLFGRADMSATERAVVYLRALEVDATGICRFNRTALRQWASEVHRDLAPAPVGVR